MIDGARAVMIGLATSGNRSLGGNRKLAAIRRLSLLKNRTPFAVGERRLPCCGHRLDGWVLRVIDRQSSDCKITGMVPKIVILRLTGRKTASVVCR